MRAGLLAAVVSGAPSTAHSLLTGADPLEAARAAGSVVLGARERRTGPLLAAAVPAHLAVSLFWAFVMPRRAGVVGGAVFGLAVAALDLGVLARWFPRVRALPLGPQVADHLVYGAVAGWALRSGGGGGS
ncbi:MAG: hypothetical protein E6G10_22055 [Actinobacteria bacterium]|nr:MAG: hypothetical protein E6G10_22055 [Actinomycetota bacterium]